MADPTAAASTGAYTHRHKSGHSIVKHGEGWAVMSTDGAQVLKRAATLDEATSWCDERFAAAAAREVLLRGAVTAIRTAEFQGREHMVADVVALVANKTIWPVNAPTPEMCPSDVLAQAPQGWNGRPCVNGHPNDGTSQITANTPRVLESYAYGAMFNAVFHEDRLCVEAWLDPVAAARVGEEALRSMERLKAGEVVEVSVGCYITVAERKGVDADGKPYSQVWESIVPDHLAILPEGQTGACSVKAGCGAGRAATVHLVTSCGIEMLPPAAAEEKPMSEDVKDPAAPPPEKPKRRTSLMQKIGTMFGFAAAGEADMSDQDVRNALEDALRAVEPGYLGVDAVFPGESKVVYMAMPGDTFITFRRSYMLAADGAATVADDREEVERVVRYEPITTAAGAPAPTTADCGCGGKAKQPAQPAGTHAASANGGQTMTDQEKAAKAVRAKALIENPTTPWAQADQAYLEGQTDARLAELEQHASGKKPVEAPKDPAPPLTGQPEPADTPPAKPGIAPGPNTPPSAPVQSPSTSSAKTEAQWLAEAPPAIRSLVTRAQQQENARRDVLVASLVSAQKVYDEPKLRAMSTEQLEETAQLVQASVPEIDYAGAGAPRTASKDDVYLNPPNGYAIGLAARKES